LLCGVSSLAPDGAGAVGIALDGASFTALVCVGTECAEDSAAAVALPSAGSVEEVLAGSSAELTYDLSEAGFAITFLHSSDASGATVSTVGLAFTPQEDVTFTLSGEYRAIDPDGELVYFSVQLIDFSGGPVSFVIDEIVAVPDASFTVGTREGATGTLSAGHLYRLNFQANDGNNFSSGDNPFSSSGFLRLSFVPEPSTALLLALGLVGLAGWRRRVV
jgi:hypothetical protein